ALLLLAGGVVSASARRPDQKRVLVRYLRCLVPIRRLAGIANCLELLVLAAGLVDLLSIGFVPRALEIAVLYVLWLLLAERLAEGALLALPADIRSGRLRTAILSPLRRLVALLRPAFQGARELGRNFVSRGPAWARALRLLLPPIVLLVALTALNEVAN